LGRTLIDGGGKIPWQVTSCAKNFISLAGQPIDPPHSDIDGVQITEYLAGALFAIDTLEGPY